MILSHQVIESLGVNPNGISLNSYQLRLLGVGSPPKKGWVSRLIGKEISDDLFEVLLKLRGKKEKSVRKSIIKEHGIRPSQLFHSSPTNRYLELNL